MNQARRLGSESSETRAVLIAAVLELMREEGYSAVTSRRLAKFASLKPQLVHYYFRTMDDLFQAAFCKVADDYLALLQQIADDEDALLKIWELSCQRKVGIQTIEFLALANRSKGIRALMAQYADTYRKIQTDIVKRALEQHGLDTGEWDPDAIAVIIENLPKVLTIGDEIGIETGYAKARSLVSTLLMKVSGTPA